MWKFCDSVVKEFRFLHKRLEDKIYLELGYIDSMPKLNPHLMERANLDDLLSADDKMSNFTFLNRNKLERPNSVHKFRPLKKEKRFVRIDWGKRIR